MCQSFISWFFNNLIALSAFAFSIFTFFYAFAIQTKIHKRNIWNQKTFEVYMEIIYSSKHLSQNLLDEKFLRKMYENENKNKFSEKYPYFVVSLQIKKIIDDMEVLFKKNLLLISEEDIDIIRNILNDFRKFENDSKSKSIMIGEITNYEKEILTVSNDNDKQKIIIKIISLIEKLEENLTKNYFSHSLKYFKNYFFKKNLQL